jgi:endonuclease/exonuclease/phosphatase (EEP) superfamily protein YafD
LTPGADRRQALTPLERSPTLPLSRWLTAAALAYPLALLLLLAALRWVGERWWLTTVALYLPSLLFALPLLPLAFLLWRRRQRWLWLGPVAAVLVLVFPLGGFVLPGSARPDGRSPVLRVLSYNVNHGYGGPARLVAEIDRFAPDVVLLEKLGDNQEPMRRLLLARYPHVDADGSMASRYPILSRFDPDQPPAADPLDQSRFYERVIDTPLGPIAFFACHPTSPRDGLMSVLRLRRGSIAVVKRETAHRSAQVARLAARAAAESIPVVIAGDTNLPSLSPLLHDRLSRYRDGFGELGWGFGYTYPFNLFRWMRIDRILASDSLRFVGFQRGSSPASDHLCVVADLQRR